MKLLSWQSGKKTYAVMAIGLGLGIAQGFGIHIPAANLMDWGLAFLGLGSLRAAVQKQAAQTAADVAKLLELLAQGASIPDPNSDTTGAVVKDTPVEVHVLQPVK